MPHRYVMESGEKKYFFCSKFEFNVKEYHSVNDKGIEAFHN